MATIINSSEPMEERELCPQCSQVPSLGFDDNFKTYTITCPNHGYEMMGATVPQAILHWNKVIAFIRRDAYRSMSDSTMPKTNQSFCIHCKKYTGIRVTQTPKLYRVDCAGCSLLKFEKEA